MTDGLHMQPKHRQVLEALLQEHLPGVEVWAYGSRVSGRSHDGSDLDLVLRGPGLKEIPIGPLGDFEEAVRESTIPFLVEARDWTRLPERFHREIERHHVVLAMGDGRKLEGNRSGVAGDGWVSLRLGDVCTKIGSGATPRGGKEVYLQDGPYALIRSQNVYNNQFHHDGLAFIDERQAAELNNVEVFADDVLLNITGDSVARVCQVAPDVLPARVNQHVAIIRPDPNKLSPRFLRYFLVSPEIQAMLLSWAGSGGTRNALTKNMIESIDVQAPKDVIEQRAVAHILGTLDDKIELNRRMNETLEAMARALFKSWFVDFDPGRAKMAGRLSDEQAGDPGLPQPLADLFPDRLVNSELGEVPEGWEVATLGDLMDLVYGKALKADNRHCGNVPVYGSNGRVGWHDEKLFVGPGIVVGRKGNPGVITWVATDFFAIDTTFVVVPKGGTQALPFMFYSLQQQDLPSIAADSAVPGLNRNLAYMNRQIVPPDVIIERFSQYIETIFCQLHRQEEESRTLATVRDTLLPKLVSGELRVSNGWDYASS